ncbi:hypothetical protein CH370_14895 [Leptospira kmetyi]|uniref:hypothetical protein n=1 Tax=Leptospira kmetyi TaxID=408139 RepID=UPI000C2AC5DA|nr:hypothetical protein [Leptospira kmetyi]PJZ40608.1 hypothetical protein CH370_14895 [Leptospira kmetyi]
MKKILPALLLTLAFFFILREGSTYLYKSKEEVRVYNTGLYFLTKTDLSSKHQSDSFLFPYALYKFNTDLSPEEFSRLCTHIWILSGLLLVFYFGIRFGHWEGIFIGFFVLLSPIVLIQKAWIGFPDHLTFFFSSATILLLDRISEDRRRFWYVLFCIVLLLGAWNHFYQFSIIVGLLVLIKFSSEKKIEWKLSGLILGTLILARILSLLLFYLKGISFEDSRLSTVRDESFFKWIAINTSVPFFALYSFFNGNLVFLVERLVKKKFLILIPSSIAAVVTFFTYDTTRVFVHLFYPSWFLLWLYFFRDEKSEFEARKKVYFALLALSLFILLLVPRFFIEAGGINYLLP